MISDSLPFSSGPIKPKSAVSTYSVNANYVITQHFMLLL